MVRTRVLCPIAALVVALSACAADAPDDVGEARLDEPVTGVTEQTASTSSEDEPASDALANCSVVTTCNAPGSDGTRCRQQPGCTAGAARLECALESVAVCGAAVCPVILIRLNGTRENLCNQGSFE